MPEAFYRVSGFHVCGPRAVRLDMLERLADLIRPLLAWRAEPAKSQSAPQGRDGRRRLQGDAGDDVDPRLLGRRAGRCPEGSRLSPRPRGALEPDAVKPLGDTAADRGGPRPKRRSGQPCRRAAAGGESHCLTSNRSSPRTQSLAASETAGHGLGRRPRVRRRKTNGRKSGGRGVRGASLNSGRRNSARAPEAERRPAPKSQPKKDSPA